MAEWKKVIVSGSSPEFAAITVDGTVTANAFSGDGSALTGVAAGSIDIDNFSALGGASVAQGDKFLFSDNGTEKSVTFSNLEDSIFGNVSGDATIAAGGALTIANTSVTNDMLAGSIANAKLANSSIDIAGTDVSLGGQITGDNIIADVSAGQIANSKLANDGITIAGNDTSLGGTITAATILDSTGVLSGSAQIQSDINDLADARIAAASVTDLSDVSSVGSGAIITTSERSKLSGIEASADVTDSTNVQAAGAVMDSEVTDLDGIKSLTVPNNTTISTFGASLVDDANASTARGTLGVDAAGTDNSTLAGLTATAIGKAIVTGSNASAIRSTIGVDAAGTDNSTDVTLAGSRNYITISGQTITRNQIDISDDTNLAAGTGVTLSGDTLSIGQDVSTGADVQFRNVTATGDLMVQGSLTSLQTTNLNIEDQFILLNSGSSDAASQGIVFGGTTGEQGVGEAFFYDADADRPAWSRNAVSWDATSAADTAYIPRVFDVDGSSHTQIAEVGSIAITGGEILIYA